MHRPCDDLFELQHGASAVFNRFGWFLVNSTGLQSGAGWWRQQRCARCRAHDISACPPLTTPPCHPTRCAGGAGLPGAGPLCGHRLLPGPRRAPGGLHAGHRHRRARHQAGCATGNLPVLLPVSVGCPCRWDRHQCAHSRAGHARTNWPACVAFCSFLARRVWCRARCCCLQLPTHPIACVPSLPPAGKKDKAGRPVNVWTNFQAGTANGVYRPVSDVLTPAQAARQAAAGPCLAADASPRAAPHQAHACRAAAAAAFPS